MQNAKPIVFLSYAEEDRRRVHIIYRALKNAGLNPWMDRPPQPWHHEGVHPGWDWDSEIRQKINQAAVILLFLSAKSVTKCGYIQREYRLALNIAVENPPTNISLVPVLLEPCTVPDLRVDTLSLRHFQYHRQYQSTLEELVQLVRNILAPQAIEFPKSYVSAQSSQSSRPLDFFALIDSIRGHSGRVAGAIANCVNAIRRRDLEEALHAAWSARIDPNDVDLNSV